MGCIWNVSILCVYLVLDIFLCCGVTLFSNVNWWGKRKWDVKCMYTYVNVAVHAMYPVLIILVLVCVQWMIPILRCFPPNFAIKNWGETCVLNFYMLVLDKLHLKASAIHPHIEIIWEIKTENINCSKFEIRLHYPYRVFN